MVCTMPTVILVYIAVFVSERSGSGVRTSFGYSGLAGFRVRVDIGITENGNYSLGFRVWGYHVQC